MPVYLQFKGWSGKDPTVPRQQLAKVFKLQGKKPETIHEWIAQGRPWKYSTPVSEAKGQQAQAFFKKLGYEVEMVPAVSGGDAANVFSGRAAVSTVQPTAAGAAALPSDQITPEHFEIPGLVWMLNSSPEQVRQKNDRRLLLIPKTSVLMMILLGIVTLGIYGVYWLTSRMEAINNLDSRNQLSAGTLKGLLATYCGLIAVNFLMIAGIVSGIEFLYSIVSLVVMVMFIVQAFKVRRILLDHLDANFIGLKTISGFLTLVLTVWFLQFKINGIHDWYAQEHGEDDELVLRSDTPAWVYAILVFFVLPAVGMVYGTMMMFNAIDEQGLGDMITPGFELTGFYSACDFYWQDAGDDQECTLEIAADMRFPYKPGSGVEVTGSGTRETFYAEARVKGSTQVFSINGRGELSLGDKNESYTIQFGKPEGE